MTYGESAQLASAALLPDSDDLRQLAGNTKSTSTSLKETHGLHVAAARPATKTAAAAPLPLYCRIKAAMATF
jgi:hypothetical protein